MIDIDIKNKTYTCPYCGEKQRFDFYNLKSIKTTIRTDMQKNLLYSDEFMERNFVDLCNIYGVVCLNDNCKKTSVVAINLEGNQIDIIPNKYQKAFPSYIPKPIIRDFQEGASIIEISPRASAILFRKCLEGMIKNCFGVCEKKLCDSIDKIFKNNQISAGQKEMLDSIRRIGNICAHFQSEDNSLFDYTSDEVNKIKDVLEYLFEEWYIEPNRRKKLQEEINQMANKKEDKNEK